MPFLGGRGRQSLPADWRVITAASVAHWSVLDGTEQADLGRLMTALVSEIRWEAAQGFALTDTIRTVIAAQASLLILGLDFACYGQVESIIVHPTTMDFARPLPGPVAGTMTVGPNPLLGQATHRGPVVIAWDAARAAARHPERGQDVVLHDFAHHLDMLDGLIDGTPPLRDPSTRNRWVQVCTHELQLLRAGPGGGLLRDYAATNPGEFFAVATEVFFNRPVDLEITKPALYEALRDFYRQDPAARARRSAR